MVSLRKKISNEYYFNHSNYKKLLEETNDYAIYTHFVGCELKPRVSINSPLRYDGTPTFNIFLPREPRWKGQIMYKDFNGMTGNVFQFVKQYVIFHYGKLLNSDETICDFIRASMKLEPGFEPVKMVIPDSFYETTEYNLKTMNFTKSHLDFWNDIGVKKDMLQFLDIHGAHYLMNEHDKILADFTGTTTFAYLIYDKFKLYQPFEENFIKFFNTCPKNYIQGYPQCQGTKGLIITKAMKDIAVYLSHLDEWIDTVAPQGEGNTIEEWMLMWILQHEYIWIIYDPDYTGVRNANKLKKQIKSSTFYRGQPIMVRFVSTERIPKNGKWTAPIKDISDFRLITNEYKTREKIKRMLYES